MNKFRLRSRFLAVRLFIAAGLTAAVLLIVRYTLARQAERQMAVELTGCRERFEAMQAQDDEMLARILAMMAEWDGIRDWSRNKSLRGADRLWVQRLIGMGADLLVLADQHGKIKVAEPAEAADQKSAAEGLLIAWSESAPESSYWRLSGKLYRVQTRRVSGGTKTGNGSWLLVAGREVGPRMAAQLKAVCGGDATFADRDGIIASTLDEPRQRELAARMTGSPEEGTAGAMAMDLANEPHRALAISLGSGSAGARLVVLRSFAAAQAQQSEFMRLMIGLGIAAMAVGFFLVLRVSDTFARPLGTLVEAVKAMEKGDFSYPVKVDSRDELGEVTQAFDQMRSSVRESQEQLIRGERLATIGQMASTISHDLRHPLTAIVANSEFLCEEKLTPEQRQEFYQEIRTAVDQMNDLVESLLEFSRGRQSPRIVLMNLDEVIERVVHSVGKRAEFQGVRLRVECPVGFECAVDPLKMERAVSNLVINACESVSTNGHGQVEVQVTAANGTAEVRVIDDGPGVPETVRKTLFQPFVSHGKAKGTGLGLAVVQKICQDHGGEASLESSRPGRTVFKLAFPRGR